MKKILATGIGSLPFKDAEQALDLIFKYTPQAPFWPQLPKRDIREGMIAQFSEHLPCLKVSSEGLFFHPQEKEKELETFYERIIAQDIDYFKISPDFALGLHRFYQRLEKQDTKDIEFIKCQISGPFTFAAGIKDDHNIALLHDAVFMQAISKGLLMKALWQINLFKQFNKKIILFLDEPYLGCFGSAYTPINREDVIKNLSELTASIKSPNVLLRQGFEGLSPEAERESCSVKGDVLSGVHCCGNTDWSIFTEIPSLDIISFDAFSFQEKFVLYADNLEDFFKRGGIVCWGIVPTQEFTDNTTVDLLISKIKNGIDTLVKKGLDRNLLLNNLWVSPSCGLGSLEVEKSAQIFKLLLQTKEKLFDKLG